jgi:hypothetical protein
MAAKQTALKYNQRAVEAKDTQQQTVPELKAKLERTRAEAARRENKYSQPWRELESHKDAAAAAEIQRIADAQQAEVNELEAELQHSKAAVAEKETEFIQRCSAFERARSPAAS